MAFVTCEYKCDAAPDTPARTRYHTRVRHVQHDVLKDDGTAHILKRRLCLSWTLSAWLCSNTGILVNSKFLAGKIADLSLVNG